MTPFALHCNNCFRMRAIEPLTLNFHLSSNCPHIVCDHCLATTCPLCKAKHECVTINNQLPKPFRHLFTKPIVLLQRCEKIAKFQSDQRSNLDGYLFEQQLKSNVDEERRRQAFFKIRKKLQEQMSVERSRCARYEAYINSHERRRMRGPNAPRSSSISSISISGHHTSAPRTPRGSLVSPDPRASRSPASIRNISVGSALRTPHGQQAALSARASRSSSTNSIPAASHHTDAPRASHNPRALPFARTSRSPATSVISISNHRPSSPTVRASHSHSPATRSISISGHDTSAPRAPQISDALPATRSERASRSLSSRSPATSTKSSHKHGYGFIRQQGQQPQQQRNYKH